MITLENAILCQSEAISTYEKMLARNLVEALQENEKLKQWRDLALAIGEREEERLRTKGLDNGNG